MDGLTVETTPTASRAKSRTRALASAGIVVVAAALFGQAAITSLSSAPAAPAKSVVRVDAGPVDKRDLAFYPQEFAAYTSVTTFKPGRDWNVAPAVDAAPPELLAGPEVVRSPVASIAKPAPKTRLVAAIPRPPARPATFAARPAAPQILADSSQERASIVGFPLPRFVPTGAAILRRIGAVGDSLGKMVRISAR